MRPKWIVGLAIGLFFLYVSYFGVAGIGLTLYPSRRTNLQAGMSWSTSEINGRYTYTYTVTSVVGSVVTVHQVGTNNNIDMQDIFDVTNTNMYLGEFQVVASGLNVGDEVFTIPSGFSPATFYVTSIESLSGKTMLVVDWTGIFYGDAWQFTIMYWQDSGVEYSASEVAYGQTVNIYQCTTADPVTGGNPTYNIIASAGSGGSISPSGTVTVNAGQNQGFTITANTNYHISDVSVDGSSVGTVSSYTFSNVQASHTISASFSPSQGTIAQVHLNAIFNGNPVTATLQIYFPDGHDESKSTPYDNLDAPVGTYSVSAIYQDKVISSYQITLASGQNFAHTFDFGNGPIVNPDYFMLIIRALLGNSQLMQLVGIAITVPSAIMLFWPKHKPQYY